MPQVLARVYVTPKRGILDPQGKAVEQALHALGFGEVADVRVGKYVELRLRDVDAGAADAKVRLREALERLVRFYELTGQPDQTASWKVAPVFSESVLRDPTTVSR